MNLNLLLVLDKYQKKIDKYYLTYIRLITYPGD